MNRILVCDDEKDIVSALQIYLGSDGYETVSAHNGVEALERLKEDENINLVLLDIMMPGMDGIATLTKIREFSNVPVIFLTAKSEDTDKILGLNVGADDYVTKPFNPVELLARVRSQLRRYTQFGSSIAQDAKQTIKNGGIEIDDDSKRVTVDGEVISLTKTEYEILLLLAKNPGRVFSPTEIYSKIWHENISGAENTISVHIRHLREKIEIDPGNPRYIKVVWGHGYMMEDKK